MPGTDIASKGSRQNDSIHFRDPASLHQELDSGVERRFGQLNGSHVVLGHDDRLAIAGLMGIGENKLTKYGDPVLAVVDSSASEVSPDDQASLLDED